MMGCCCGGCTVTLSGTTFACAGVSGSGAVVTVKDHATGATLGTATGDGASHYSVSFTIPGSSLSVDVTISKTGACPSTATVTVSCGSNTYSPHLAICPFTVQVNGCSGAQTGVPVTFAQTGYTFSGTTDGSGQVTVSPTSLTPGTISWTAPGSPAGYAGGSQSYTPVCGGGTVTVTLATATGYSCSPDLCCPPGDQTGPPFPPVTYPATIVLNDGTALTTLTQGGTFLGVGGHPALYYTGCNQLTAALQAWATPNHTSDASTAGVPVWVYYQAWCDADGSGNWEVDAFLGMSLTVPDATPLPATTDPAPAGSGCFRFPAIWDCPDVPPWCSATGVIWHAGLTQTDCPPTLAASGTTNINGDSGNVWPGGVLTVSIQQ